MSGAPSTLATRLKLSFGRGYQIRSATLAGVCRKIVLAGAFEYVPSCAAKLCDRLPEYDGSRAKE